MTPTLTRALRYAVPVLVAVIVAASADALSRNNANQLTGLLLLASLAMAWNLVSGFAGQFSLGHSIFVGVGGYTTAAFLNYLDYPLPLVVIAAGVVSAALGVLLAYPLLRLRGPYFAIGTLGIALAVLGWMLNWDFTRASRGYPVPPGALLDIATLLKVAAVLALVTFVVSLAIKDSPLGLRRFALRDNEDGASSLGVRRVRTIVPIWAISAFLTGMLGAVIALQNGNLTPNSAFSIQYTLDAVVVCVIGGLGTASGPLIGALIVFVIRQYTADFASWASLLEALIVILVVRFFPDGAVGVLTRIGEFIRKRRATSASSIATDQKASSA